MLRTFKKRSYYFFKEKAMDSLSNDRGAASVKPVPTPAERWFLISMKDVIFQGNPKNCIMISPSYRNSESGLVPKVLGGLK